MTVDAPLQANVGASSRKAGEGAKAVALLVGGCGVERCVLHHRVPCCRTCVPAVGARRAEFEAVTAANPERLARDRPAVGRYIVDNESHRQRQTRPTLWRGTTAAGEKMSSGFYK